MKNKNAGARVIVKKLLVEISPEVGWKHMKNVSGVIVGKTDSYYYHTCSGGQTNVKRWDVKKDLWNPYLVRLDNGVVDIEGNNEVPVREFDIKFLDNIEPVRKPITEKQYLRAKKLISDYEKQNS